MQPLVSIYITTFNRLLLLKRAVDSVLNQSYKNIELLVADDGSTDGTHEYLKEMQQKGILTAVINDSSPKGACFGRNAAIEIAKGEFMTGLDDDDYLENWRIQTFVDYWHEYENNALNINPIAGLFDSVIELRAGGEYKYNETIEVSYSDLRRANKIGNQIFTRLEYFKNINGFDIGMPALQDWETWIRLARLYGKFINVNSYSYIIDLAHGGTRISEKKADKIRHAFDLLEAKLAPLSVGEKINLTETLFAYPQIKLRKKDILYLVLGARFRRIGQITKRYLLK